MGTLTVQVARCLKAAVISGVNIWSPAAPRRATPAIA